MHFFIRIFRLSLVVLATAAMVVRLDAQPEPRFVSQANGIPGEYIVVLYDGAVGRPLGAAAAGPSVAQLATQLAGAHGGRVFRTYERAFSGFAVRLPEKAARALAKDARVKLVEQNATVPLSNVTEDCGLGTSAPVPTGPIVPSSPQTIACANPSPSVRAVSTTGG